MGYDPRYKTWSRIIALLIFANMLWNAKFWTITCSASSNVRTHQNCNPLYCKKWIGLAAAFLGFQGIAKPQMPKHSPTPNCSIKNKKKKAYTGLPRNSSTTSSPSPLKPLRISLSKVFLQCLSLIWTKFVWLRGPFFFFFRFSYSSLPVFPFTLVDRNFFNSHTK